MANSMKRTGLSRVGTAHLAGEWSPVRFWGAACAGAAAVALALVTLVSRDWIEAFSGVNLDHGNGELEWLVVGALSCSAVFFVVRAGRIWVLRGAGEVGS